MAYFQNLSRVVLPPLSYAQGGCCKYYF